MWKCSILQYYNTNLSLSIKERKKNNNTRKNNSNNNKNNSKYKQFKRKLTFVL